MSSRALFLVVAAVAFVAAVGFARTADRERCLGAVAETISVQGGRMTVERALERDAPGGRWRVSPDPRGRLVAWHAPAGSWTWLCVPEGVPLVEAVSAEARALTPLKDAQR